MKDWVIKISELLAAVPREPGTTIPAGAFKENVNELHFSLGYEVPPALRAWLYLSNAPCVGPGGLFGIGAVPSHLSMTYHISLHPEWREKKWIPVAGDGCGNYYILVAGGEFGAGFPVVFLEAIGGADSPAYVVSSDLWHFIFFLLSKDLGQSGWPFNESDVIGCDPEIVRVTAISFPWSA